MYLNVSVFLVSPCPAVGIYPKPVLVAGMAASNIEGQTLHTTFKLKFGDDYQSLSDKARDQLRDHFKDVKVVVIDEMSMMKSSQLYHLHLRLCDLMQNSEIMGGVSVLLFGK